MREGKVWPLDKQLIQLCIYPQFKMQFCFETLRCEDFISFKNLLCQIPTGIISPNYKPDIKRVIGIVPPFLIKRIMDIIPLLFIPNMKSRLLLL